MNAWNSIENQLRKWTPRPLSPELRSRIFAQEDVGPARWSFHFGEATRWFVPALGCFLLVMSSLSTRFQESSAGQFSGTNIMLASTTNERAAAEIFYSKNQEHSEKNSIPCTKVEYGFAARPMTSTVGSFLISYTNRLIQ